MAESERLGFSVSGGLKTREIIDCAVLAEELGYESFWVAEGHGGDQFAVLSACAMVTSRIRLGTSISSVFVRTLPTIAMAAASLHDISGGRFVLGLGSSHRVQVEPEHGVSYGLPVTRVREAVHVIRQLLATGSIRGFRGETVSIEQFDFWFEREPGAISIYLAGLFPKMLETCGEVGEGLILTRSTLETASTVREHLSAGAARAGRDVADIEISSLLPCAVADTQAAACDQIRPSAATYAGFFPRYNRLMATSGFPEAAEAIAKAWAAGDREAAIRAVPDALIQSTGVVGTVDQCRERIAAYRDSGLELPIIGPRTDRIEDFVAALRACARS